MTQYLYMKFNGKGVCVYMSIIIICASCIVFLPSEVKFQFAVAGTVKEKTLLPSVEVTSSRILLVMRMSSSNDWGK